MPVYIIGLAFVYFNKDIHIMQDSLKLDFKGVVVLVAAFVVANLLIAGYAVFHLLVLKDEVQYSMGYTMVSFVLSMGLPILAFDFGIVRPKIGQPLHIPFKLLPTTDYLLTIPMMFGMGFMAEVVTSWIPTDSGVLGEWYQAFNGVFKSMAYDKVGMLIIVVIFSPIFEELIFRGIILKGLLNNGMAPKTAIVLSSVVFGIVHGNPWQFLGAAMLGLVLGLAYYKTKSILLTMILHALNNLVACLMLFYVGKDSFIEALGWNPWIIFFIGAVLFGVFYYLFMHRKVHHLKGKI